MRFRFDRRELSTLPFRPRDAVTFGIKPAPCPNHYVINDRREAYRRVLLPGGNPTPQYDRSGDIVGPTGHLERANAWTHLVGCAITAAYALARVWIFDAHSLASQLSGLSVTFSSITFATSVMYHVFGTVPGYAGIMRNIDITAIYVSLGVASVADAALVTNDFAGGVPTQCILDPLIATTALGTFFVVRRLVVPKDETRITVFEDACQLGLYRRQHSDLEHAGLRSGGISALMFVWVLLLPAAFGNLSDGVAAVYLAGRIFGSGLLVAGVLFDAALLPDRALAGTEGYWDRAGVACGCASKTLGCVMTAHAWWHVLSLLATIAATASRDYGVSQMLH